VTFFAIGRLILLAGLALAALGAALIMLDALGVGHLPGTFVWRRGGVTVFAPIGVMIVVSVVLTVALNLLLRR
jgi:hypothetical protein